MSNQRKLSLKQMEGYQASLVERECSESTVGKYMRAVRAFYKYLPDNKEIDKARVMKYKMFLSERYKCSSANSMLVSINGLLSFLGWEDCKVCQLRIQRQAFRTADKELTKAEYLRLLKAASNQKNERLNLLMQTICSTGIRVSELEFVTAEALKDGEVFVRNKGKERQVFLTYDLVKQLRRYCNKQGITSGPIFITRSGCPMSRGNIWAAMKMLAEEGGVDSRKIFPHNLRHLFALTFYEMEKDVVHLADILGHESINTTRIYTATSSKEHRRSLSKMQLCYDFSGDET